MESKIRKGSMREHINTIYTALRKDEYLMRILYFKPLTEELNMPVDYENAEKTIPILDREDYWDIVDDRMLTTTKSSDIEDKKALCRLYIYPGRRKPRHGNYLLADQEIVIDILVHESYSSDLRQQWISDRIYELIVLERLTGIGKIEFVSGAPRQSPIGYDKYETVYLITDGKK